MLHTYQFAFRGRTRYIDAENMFAAMVEFHALFADSILVDIDELVINKLK